MFVLYALFVLHVLCVLYACAHILYMDVRGLNLVLSLSLSTIFGMCLLYVNAHIYCMYMCVNPSWQYSSLHTNMKDNTCE